VLIVCTLTRSLGRDRLSVNRGVFGHVSRPLPKFDESKVMLASRTVRPRSVPIATGFPTATARSGSWRSPRWASNSSRIGCWAAVHARRFEGWR